MNVPDKLWFDIVVFTSACKCAEEDSGILGLKMDAAILLKRMEKIIEK